jgi:hypothetical protein
MLFISIGGWTSNPSHISIVVFVHTSPFILPAYNILDPFHRLLPDFLSNEFKRSRGLPIHFAFDFSVTQESDTDPVLFAEAYFPLAFFPTPSNEAALFTYLLWRRPA